MIETIVEQLFSRDTHWVVQFAKYALCGALATATDLLIFYALSWRLIPALKADDLIVKILKVKIKPVDELFRGRNFLINTGIAFLFSNFVAYTTNMLWVFEPGRHVWYVEVALFYGVSLISISIGAFLGWAMIRWFKLSTTSSYLGKVFAALIVNFICRKFIIFKG